MKRISVFLMAAVTGVAVTASTGLNSMAAEEEYVPDVESKILHKAPLPGFEGKEVIVMQFTAPPEFLGEKHYHPGPVYVYVLEGELAVEIEGETKTYMAGDFFPEPVDMAMTPKNPSASGNLKLLVFQINDAGRPMMIKAE